MEHTRTYVAVVPRVSPDSVVVSVSMVTNTKVTVFGEAVFTVTVEGKGNPFPPADTVMVIGPGPAEYSTPVADVTMPRLAGVAAGDAAVAVYMTLCWLPPLGRNGLLAGGDEAWGWACRVFTLV